MANKLDVKGKTINQIVRLYFDNELYVNRRYQRKLVWSIEEKKLYIDSLLQNYPTPSIMLNALQEEDEDGNKYDKNEIVDGVQRLDAILSFIINDFSIEFEGYIGYFDMSVIPSAQQRVVSKLLVQKEPILPMELCYNFADCEIPVVLTGQDDKKIKEIFCRINSSGKKISLHDLRQASSADAFADLVRRCAIRIRGDYTYYDSILMSDMRKVSISGKGLKYGISHKDIFWRRHDIITYENLRRSRDEEIVASLLINILLNNTKRVNSNMLDKVYKEGSEENQAVINAITVMGKEKLEEQFNDVVVMIDTLFYSVKSTFSVFLFKNSRVSKKDEMFQVLFLALYNLQKESYIIKDYEKIAKSLEGNISYLFSSILKKSTFTTEEWSTVYEVVFDFLRKRMWSSQKREETPEELEIKHRLSLSDFESAMVEFKIGMIKIGKRSTDKKFIDKIGQTLVGMANSPVDKEGYLILGIADNEQAALKWEQEYQKTSLKYGNHYVVGIEDEALCRYGKVDDYQKAIVDLLKDQPISIDLKQYILSNIQIINFYDRKLVLLKSKRQDEDSFYNNEKYIRNGESTIKVI